jgi:hypothetical protein
MRRRTSRLRARIAELLVECRLEETVVSEAGPFRTIEFRGQRLGLPVYLDHHATTPLDPRVLDAMLPYLTERFGNPHSAGHAYGWAAEEAVERARTEVAALIGALPEEILFASGATEANNLALRGPQRSPASGATSSPPRASIPACSRPAGRSAAKASR